MWPACAGPQAGVVWSGGLICVRSGQSARFVIGVFGTGAPVAAPQHCCNPLNGTPPQTAGTQNWSITFPLAENSFGELLHDPEREYRGRTIDLLFQSVAKYGKGRVIGIILSGALDDGARGLASIHNAGGLTMVLTPAERGGGREMPKNAIEVAGPIDLIGTPAEIARSVMAAISA